MRRVPLLPLACLALLPACKGTENGNASDPVTASKPVASGANVTGKCDPAKLSALTREIATAAPGAGPDLVAARLGEACELPRVFASFFALSAPRDGEPPPLAAIRNAPEEAHDALTQICPDASVIRKQLQSERGEDRPGLLYERCDFKRFGLVAKEAWVRGEPSSPVPFFAYHWFVEQGVGTADAKSLATAMLLRDRRRWALSDQQLPTIAQPLAAIPEGTVVHVSPTHITVNEMKVATLVDGQIDEAALQGHLIGPLFDVLSEEAEKSKQMAEATSSDWRGTLVLVADAATPQSVLVNVMYSAGRAEFNNYAFVGQSAPFEHGAVLVDPPKFFVKPPPQKAAEFLVFIASDGFRVRASTSDKTPTHIPMAKGGELDLEALTAAAQAHKKANPTATVARVHAEDETRFGALAQSLATLSGSDCNTTTRACLLPKLVVGAGGPRDFGPESAARKLGVLGMAAKDDGHFIASPYGGVFDPDEEHEDPWGGLTSSEVGRAFGEGGLGLVGTGRGGGGTGEGTIGLGNTGLIGKGGGGKGFGGRGKKVPRVRQGKATVSDGLDGDIVRRIVRAHINEVRHCYNQGLAKDPKLSGGVTIGFTIAATGKVSTSSVSKDGLGDGDVSKCVAKAVKRWKFPKPSDGSVDVVYPFELEPG